MNGPLSPAQEKVPVSIAEWALLETTYEVSFVQMRGRGGYTIFGIPGLHTQEESGSLAFTASDFCRKFKIANVISYMYESRHDLSKANPTSLVISGSSDELLGSLEICVMKDRESGFTK
jgi:hypothetical protein